MLLTKTRDARRLTILRWTAVLCLLLMVFAATVEARHSHSTDRDAQRCSVCVVAHSPTLIARVATVKPINVSQPLVTLFEAPVVSALSHDSLYIRPPPSPESL
ncbi:MAG: hypothetical protein M3P27_05550 [Acidobacteriota bacterium]|nr:hypothetical protein [Acidobacteriota bacterium]